MPVFGFDYLLGTRSVTESEDSIKILVAKCQMTKCTFAHVVPQKVLAARPTRCKGKAKTKAEPKSAQKAPRRPNKSRPGSA